MPESTAVVASDEAVEKVRPLSTAQASALKKLIKNDYENLRNDLHAHVKEETKRRIEAVEEQYKVAGVDEKAITRKVHAAVKKFNDTMTALRESVEEYDVTLGLPYLNGAEGYRFGQYPDRDITVRARGREEAIHKVHRDMGEAEDAARRALHRAETAAERQVLVAQVTGTAEQILAAIPSPQELFAQAQQQITAQAIES